MEINKIKKWVLRSFTIAVVIASAIILVISMLFYSWRSNLTENERYTKSIININNGFVEYVFEEKGDKTIFYSHATPDNFFTSTRRLSNNFDYSFLAPARPGYFDSMIATGRTPEEQADMFAELMESLDIENVVMWGVSGGGPAAVKFAIKYPEKCSGLILQASYFSESDFKSKMAIFDDSFESEVGYWIKLHWDKYWVNDDQTKMNMERYLESIIPFAFIRNGLLNDRLQMSQLKLDDVTKVTCPTLIIHGSDDEYVPFSKAEEFALLLSGATLIELEGVGHYESFLTAENAVLSEVKTFLKDVF